MGKHEAGRKLGGLLGSFVMGSVGAYLKDALGLPFLYVCGVAALGFLVLGWWPEFKSIPGFTRRIRRCVGAAVLAVAALGFVLSFYLGHPEPPRPHFRMVNIVQGQLPGRDDIRFNVTYTNDGPEDLRGLTQHMTFGYTNPGDPPFTKEQLDEHFRQLDSVAPDPANVDEFEPNDPALSTYPSGASDAPYLWQKRLQDWHKEGRIYYVLLSFGYFTGPPKTHFWTHWFSPAYLWHTHWCRYWDLRLPDGIWQTQAPHICPSHNGIVGPERSG